MRYVLFTTKTCSYCLDAQELLEKNEKKFNVINFEQDQLQVLQEVKAAYDWPTVPMVFKIDDNGSIVLIGGFTDLQSHLDS